MQEIDYLSFKKSKISFAFLKGWVIIFQHQFKGGPQIFVHLLKGGLPKLQTPNIWFSQPIPPFTLWPVPYIILLFVNFTTLPYFAYTGEHLVKIRWKSEWYWARSSDFPENAKKGVCTLQGFSLKLCTSLKPEWFFLVLCSHFSLSVPLCGGAALRLVTLAHLDLLFSSVFLFCLVEGEQG